MKTAFYPFHFLNFKSVSYVLPRQQLCVCFCHRCITSLCATNVPIARQQWKTSSTQFYSNLRLHKYFAYQ